MTLLSISASFGALVWIFQEGHLADLLHFHPLGYTIAGNPIIMFAVVFGLSMDYEVLLLPHQGGVPSAPAITRLPWRVDWSAQDSDHDAAGLYGRGCRRLRPPTCCS